MTAWIILLIAIVAAWGGEVGLGVVRGGRSTLPPLPEVLDVPTHQPSLF